MCNGDALRKNYDMKRARNAKVVSLARTCRIQILRWASIVSVLLAFAAGGSLAQTSAPSQVPEAKQGGAPNVTQSPALNQVPEAKQAGTSRAQQFEALRRERSDVLRQIDEKNRRLRSIDRELSSLREQLGRAVEIAVSPVATNRSIAQLKATKEFAERSLATREADLKKNGLTDAEIAADQMILERKSRLRQIDFEIQAAEESQQESDRAQKEEAERNAAIEAQKKKAQNRIEELNGEQERLQTEITKLTLDLDDINFKAVRLIDTSDAEGTFRFNTSFMFSGLVLIVIVGFFWVAHSDVRIRYAIFANDSGIQFITLFSIVIAVILFGIIGVLEGKELSALLGGLSGYILGRQQVAGTKRSSDDPENIVQGQTPGVQGQTPGAT
jgi:hypothetical protein